MRYLYEKDDMLNAPFEAFWFDTSKEEYELPVKFHWHYFMEMIYMTEGTVATVCDDVTYMLGPGDLMVYHPQTVHSVYAASLKPVRYAVLKFDINRLYQSYHSIAPLGAIYRSARRSRTAPVHIPENNLGEIGVGETVVGCIQEIQRKSYGYDLRCQSYVISLLVEILRYWEQSFGFSIDQAAEQSLAAPDSFPEVLEYIDNHLSDAIRVEELAERCHMSYSHFARKFREAYGRSCKEYIDFIRTSKAEDFLLFTNQDLNYISQETGFSDCSHLIRTFKKRFGMTPKQYRMTKKRRQEEWRRLEQ